LAYGEFINWLSKIGMDRYEATRFMKIAKELPNLSTLRDLGTTALYLIAKLPDEKKQEQIEKIEQGESPTIRELQDLKRKLKESEERNKRLAEQANFRIVQR